jgi:molybdopterin/thiamine biosynthesis adenylyltransferase
LLLGYPVPTRIGDSQLRLRWEACDLREAAAGARLPSNEQRLKWANVYDRRALMRQVRGQLSPELGNKSILLLGAGALGSSLAELLVRGGVNRLCIADGESVHLGNLVRHTLTVSDLGINKAIAVAARLNASSLDARVMASAQKLSSKTLSEFSEREPDIVLDATGSDQVLSDLAAWQRPTLFLSVSLGLYARRIYLFAAQQAHFPVEVFHEQMQPWLKRDRDDTKDLPLPATEGIGCWSPVFPARLDDISLLASAAVKWIEECVAQPPLAPRLTVFEREGTAGCFMGVRRAHGGSSDC